MLSLQSHKQPEMPATTTSNANKPAAGSESAREQTGPNSQGASSNSLGVDSEGTQGGDCTREMLMTLTRDELKDIVKARNLSATGFERRPKAGKIYRKRGTLSTNKSESSNRSYFIDPRSIEGSPPLTASYQRDHTSCKYLSSVVFIIH